MATLAILSALAEEQQGLLACLSQPVCLRRAGREVWRGQWLGHTVLLALSRIGKVAAATTTTALIEGLGATHVVFTGVAGGIGTGVRVGDLVVATEFVQHDLDASPLFPRFEIPLYGRSRLGCDPGLTALLLRASEAAATRLTGQFSQIIGPERSTVHAGLIASGDRFVSGASELQGLQQRLQAGGHAPLAVEMEGAAVAQVCFDYGVPFAAVRTISDRADDAAHVDFPRFVREVASPYAHAIMTAFLELLSKK
ncbi:MAG: 5'-methylthioadenosine/adenosylhomocysteine nucleosidase [Burkholderiales bacterium]|nr:5'-methylthioadenosine/adenosylhomocysteine nucleosidase [Burkholderiales bacterium]